MFSWFRKDKADDALKSQDEAERPFAAAEDITELKKSQHDEKLAAAHRLASSIVFEIINPLYAVENMIQIIRDSDNPDEIKKMAILADGQMQRILQITDQRRRFLQSDRLPQQGDRITERSGS